MPFDFGFSLHRLQTLWAPLHYRPSSFSRLLFSTTAYSHTSLTSRATPLLPLSLNLALSYSLFTLSQALAKIAGRDGNTWVVARFDHAGVTKMVDCDEAGLVRALLCVVVGCCGWL